MSLIKHFQSRYLRIPATESDETFADLKFRITAVEHENILNCIVFKLQQPSLIKPLQLFDIPATESYENLQTLNLIIKVTEPDDDFYNRKYVKNYNIKFYCQMHITFFSNNVSTLK